MNYWLMKSEPDVFSIDDLKKDGETLWDGVRNYQARNFMRDDMKIGDKVLFYHSNAKPPGIAGIAEISSPEPVADPSQFKKNSEYYDPKSTKENPRWQCVKVKFSKKLNEFLPLDSLREVKALSDMPLFNRSRLSIQPVTKKQFECILKLAKEKS